MTKKKNSLLTRIILLNNLSTFIVTLVLMSIVSFFLFTSLNSERVQDTLEKTVIIEKKFNGLLDTLKDSAVGLKSHVPEKEVTHFEELDAWQKKQFENFILAMFSEKYRKNLHVRVYDLTKGEEKLLSRYGDEKIENLTEISELLKTGGENNAFLKQNNNILKYYIVEPLKNSNRGILIEFNVDRNILGKIIEENIFGTETYLAFVENGKYLYGNFSGKVDGEELGYEGKKSDGIYLEKRKVGGREYLLSFLPLKDKNGIVVGDFLVATSDAKFKKIETITFLFIFLSSVILMGMNTYVFTKIFSMELMPLNKLSQISKKISTGSYSDITFPESSILEISNLSQALKEQVDSISTFKKEISKQNKKLKNTLLKINTLESIVTSLRLTEKEDEMLEQILKGLTSQWGLGFARAIMFKYIPGQIQLVGEKVFFNDPYWEQLSHGGKLIDRRETFKEVVPLIKINLEKNIFAEAVFEDKIISFNEKGFLHNFGSDLMSGFTINNFAIVPIYKDKAIYGAILVDNFLKNSKMTKEDIDIFNVLKLNIEITLKNKKLELNRSTLDKEGIVNRIINRYLAQRHGFVEKTYDYLKEIKNNQKYKEEGTLLELEAFEILQTEKLIFDYSSTKSMEFKRFDISALVREKNDEMAKYFIDKEFYFFGNESINILGDYDSLGRVFHEIYENAIQSIPIGGEAGEIKTVIRKTIDSVEIEINDNGSGMSKNYLDKHLFEPFISEKENHIGLGLSMVNKIVARHNGRVLVSSKRGEGTTITIILNREEK